MAYTFKHGDRPVDGYTIQRAVGRGGFGEVYYAISDGGREVAFKYLRDNPQIELRGVSHCINLKSPHLVSIFDVKQTTDGEYGIIMEYCSGPSLRDLLIAEPNGFEPQKAAFFMREIAKGLSYLHDRGIVHRDLKPGNIFYDDGYVKIGDYGLSKFISVSRHSAQTSSVGTVHYMAPEIGSGNYSHGVDIYALGVMLYEMLLGKVPFEGSSMAEVLMKHLTAQPELDELPEPFGQVIRKALQKDPKDRYQSVGDMVTELLDVDEVRESLAGFRPQSLDGAVRHVVGNRVDSPMPSPNPLADIADKIGRAADGGPGQPPYALPVGGGGPLPRRLGKKMDRISRKFDKKIAKLGGKPLRPRAMRPAEAARGLDTAAAVPQLALADRRKRMALSGLLSIGLAVGLGLLIGNTHFEEAGAAAGMLVITMSGGVILSRKAIGWFGIEFAPKWPQRIVQVACCAPLLAIGAAPMLDARSDEGVALFLGLLFCAVFFDAGEKRGRHTADTGGEISFGRAIWAAFIALVCTAIAAEIFGASADEVMFIAAGVTGAASLILQASAWWLQPEDAPAFNRPRSGAEDGSDVAEPPPSPVTLARSAAARAHAAHLNASERFDPEGTALTEPQAQARGVSPVAGAPGSVPRWGITRAFWSLAAFVLMGGAIVTFLIPLIADSWHHSDITGAIVGCTACASFMIFALRKTTPLKRDGFWRETLRPFLISATMFGIGGTITGIAREWGYVCENGHNLGDDEKIGLVFGLVMSSLLFLGLTFFTGRPRRIPKPFVLDEVADEDGSDPGPTGRGDHGEQHDEDG